LFCKCHSAKISGVHILAEWKFGKNEAPLPFYDAAAWGWWSYALQAQAQPAHGIFLFGFAIGNFS
jgi:hypothetical protein